MTDRFAELLADPRPLVGQPGQNFHGPDFDRYRDGAVDHPVERDFDRPVQPPVVQPQGFLSKQERKDFREMPLRAMTAYFRVTVDERAQMRFHSFRVCRERVFQSVRRAESDSRVGIGAQIDRLGEQALTSDQSAYPLPEAGRRSDGQDLSQLFACHKCSGWTTDSTDTRLPAVPAVGFPMLPGFTARSFLRRKKFGQSPKSSC